jgi:hypothetical protein
MLVTLVLDGFPHRKILSYVFHKLSTFTLLWITYNPHLNTGFCSSNCGQFNFCLFVSVFRLWIC